MFNARHLIFSNNAKTMELQTGDYPGLDRPTVAFTKTQFAVSTTTVTCFSASILPIYDSNIA